MSLIDKANSILLHQNKTLIKTKELNMNTLDNIASTNYCLYRFLDKNNNVLYLGKCTKSKHSNGRDGLKDYYIKDRLTQHFSMSSKLPKSLYLNIDKIEVCFPIVENNVDLETLESNLISFYEREKLQCFYCRDIKYGFDLISEDNMDWNLFYRLDNSDYEHLKNTYGYSEIPPVGIINDRLKIILWIMEKYKFSNCNLKEEC